MSDYFVHESSFVDDGAQIGAGTRIWHFAHIYSGARIGEMIRNLPTARVLPTPVSVGKKQNPYYANSPKQ